MLIGSPFKICGLDLEGKFFLNGEVLQYTDQYNYLGLILDKHISLNPLLPNLKSRIVNKMYSLIKIRSMISTQCAIAVYKLTVLPILYFSGFFLISCNVSELGDLQKLQNHALRVCYDVKLRDRVSIENMHNRADY